MPRSHEGLPSHREVGRRRGGGRHSDRWRHSDNRRRRGVDGADDGGGAGVGRDAAAVLLHLHEDWPVLMANFCLR